MSRINPPNSIFGSKAFSMRPNASSGRSSPSSSLHSAPGGVATFISSRNHRPPSFQRRHPTDPGSSDEPDESGGIGIGIGIGGVGVGVGAGVNIPQYRRYESDEDDEDESVSSPPPLHREDSTYDDSRSVTSRASTPRQHTYPRGQQALRIPDFQQILNRDDVFEDDKTPSFEESTVVQLQQQQQQQPGRMEHMRMPVPGDSQAPWGKRGGSEDAAEIKSESQITQQQQHQSQQQHSQDQRQQRRSGFEKVSNTAMRLEVAAYNDEDHIQTSPQEIDREYRKEVQDPIARGHEDEEDEEYFTNDYSDDDGSDFDEPELEKKTGPGLWSEGSPTMSSRAWSQSGTRSKGSPGSVQPQKKAGETRFNGNGKGTGKARERKDQGYDAQKLDFRPPKSTVLPLAVRRPISDPILDLQLSPRARAELAVQAATNNTIAVISERSKSKEPPPRRMIATTPNDIDLHHLLPDSELASIRTFSALLSHLAALRAKSHDAIPADQLPVEIDELARSYYPHDPRKPERFFNRLDDAQHAAAGEYILGKKREMEAQLVGVVAKRRRLVEGMVAEVEGVAEIRVGKLGRTEERREVLRGGVGRMLREAGLWL